MTGTTAPPPRCCWGTSSTAPPPCAPGTDQRTMLPLRLHLANDVDSFPHDVQELFGYFDEVKPGQPVPVKDHMCRFSCSFPAYSAPLAATMGLPFLFRLPFQAGHAVACAESLSRAFHAIAHSGTTLCHGLYQRDRAGGRYRGAVVTG